MTISVDKFSVMSVMIFYVPGQQLMLVVRYRIGHTVDKWSNPHFALKMLPKQITDDHFILSVCWCEQGLLALEGELTPILVQMVKSANMNGLLDNDSDSLSSCQHRVKARLHEILQKDRDFTDEDFDRVISNLHSTLWAEYVSVLWVPEEGRMKQHWETLL